MTELISKPDPPSRDASEVVDNRHTSPVNDTDQLYDDAPMMDDEPPDISQELDGGLESPQRSPSVDDIEVETQLEPDEEDESEEEKSSSPVPAEAAPVDESLGTVIPETQLTKANTSSENSSQPSGHHVPTSTLPEPEQTTTILEFTVDKLPENAKAKGKLGPIPVVTPSKEAISIADKEAKVFHYTCVGQLWLCSYCGEPAAFFHTYNLPFPS